ncbi:hypothetical protein BH09PAT4_BH09PAT4_07960 [soil metagenome]
MDDQKQQLIDKLQSATNILVTVSSNPSVDQLAACIGLTVALNKMDKHATAVFSGDIPETIEFLKPEATIEKNTDSLRDFIIALDKTKADKLRYKVEDKVVKIFITPYRTSISQDDLNFSQGDFNVDAVLALGVREQQDLDQAITAHGRILHDATVLGVHNQAGGELGSINWVDESASSLSELAAFLIKQLDKKLIDEQIATALLTGIVASTDRFRNQNTSATTMSVSADLMAAGANQQLVTSELEHTVELRDPAKEGAEDNASTTKESNKPKKPKAQDGTLEIDHGKNESVQPDQPVFDPAKFETHDPDNAPAPEAPASEEPAQPDSPQAPDQPSAQDDGRDVMTEPPRFDSPLTANDKPFQPSPDLGNGKDGSDQLLSRTFIDSPEPPVDLPAPTDVAEQPQSTPQPASAFVPSEPATVPTAPESSASTPPQPPSFESAGEQPQPQVDQPQQEQTPAVDVDAARDEVMRALSEQPNETLPPIAALNAQPFGGELHGGNPTPPLPQQPAVAQPAQPLAPAVPDMPPASHSPADQPMDMPLPPSDGLHIPPPQGMPPTNAPAGSSPNAPPPVPPPMLPPAWPGAPQQ